MKKKEKITKKLLEQVKKLQDAILVYKSDIENLKQSKDRLEKLDIVMSFEDMSKDILTSDILEG